ncbi:MAG: prepilin-type N-terminal cleavage/methylation domain-containing protein, partial [Oscillospiraceae bacterium]|nr:prepilin-type N-terminal cleavage/methylation domain-containing protein [Oscillospiraceae bacterium]
MNTEIKNTIKNEKGFTLVELIVVIAILAVLAAVAIPNYMSYQHRSKINTDVSTVSELLRSAKMYYIERGTEPSFSDLV